MRTLTIATRGSKLALWQAEHIQSRLLALHPGLAGVYLLVLKTKGDIIQDVPLAKVGGKGLFVKEIEEALLDGRADLAVHSMKDVPMLLQPGLTLGAVPERESAVDLFLSFRHASFDALPPGALVGTSSLRRQSQILSLRPDLTVSSLRGNVDTRLRKLTEGQFDAIIMAEAGMKRLGLSAPHAIPFSAGAFIPAAGQGALGIEHREDRVDIAALLRPLDHEPTRLCVTAERAFLAELEGNCQVPIAAHATLDATGALHLTGLVMDPAGKRAVRKNASGPASDAARLGRELAAAVRADGGAELLRAETP